MRLGPHRRLRVALVSLALPTLAAPSASGAIRDVRAGVRFLSSTRCEVTLRGSVDAGDSARVSHHVSLRGAAGVAISASVPDDPIVEGATLVEVRRTPEALRFDVALPDGHEGLVRAYGVTLDIRGTAHGTCPLPVPSVPTPGAPGNVALEVTWPTQAGLPAGAFPALTWEGLEGRSGLGHVPAFVRVLAGPSEWLGRLPLVLDAAALGSVCLASLAWLRRRRRR